MSIWKQDERLPLMHKIQATLSLPETCRTLLFNVIIEYEALLIKGTKTHENNRSGPLTRTCYFIIRKKKKTQQY